MNSENTNDDFSLSSSQSSLMHTKDESGLRVGQHLNNMVTNSTQLHFEDINPIEDRKIKSPPKQDFSFIHKNRIPSPLNNEFQLFAKGGSLCS
jgi:hypothetical protein